MSDVLLVYFIILLRNFSRVYNYFIQQKNADPIKGNDISLIYGNDETGYSICLGKAMMTKLIDEMTTNMPPLDIDEEEASQIAQDIADNIAMYSQE